MVKQAQEKRILCLGTATRTKESTEARIYKMTKE